jgi:DNA-binding response OmpR family regulator
VVEDDAKVGAFLEQGLREEAFEVDRVLDGSKAIELACATKYDLILLDYMLPRKSGVEVASTLRAKGLRVPILMLTARDAPEDIQSVFAAGVDDLMGKPFRFDDLLGRIRHLTRDGQ